MKKFACLIGIMVTLVLPSCNRKKGVEEGKVIYDTIPVTNIKITPEYYFAGDFTYMADAAVLKETVTGQHFPIVMAEAYPQAEKKYRELELSGKPVYTELRGYLQLKGKDEEGPARQLVITQLIKMGSVLESPMSLLNGKYAAENKKLFINPDHTYKLTSKDEKDMEGKWFLVTENALILNSGEDYVWMDIDWRNHTLSNRKDNSFVFSLIP